MSESKKEEGRYVLKLVLKGSLCGSTWRLMGGLMKNLPRPVPGHTRPFPGQKQTKAPNSDYHKDEPPAAARQAEVARNYLKLAAKIDELNSSSPGSDGPMVTALKRHNGGRVLVFVVGAFAEMPEDVSRICDIIAHDLARTHVLY